MTLPTSEAGIPAYPITARVLHWLTAVLVLAMVPVGIVIANEWGGPAQQFLYNLHKSIGALLIPIVIVRLLYRLTYTVPPLPADIPAIQVFAAHATHWMLYTLILVQPIIGWIATSAFPAPVPFFGLFELPSIWPADRALSDRLLAVHRVIGLTIGFVAAMHIGAALYHHFVRKDRVLMRMVSG
ncbi:MAG: cytochrome b [Xanthobacteraceae bacterium]